MACRHKKSEIKQKFGHQMDWEPEMIITALHRQCLACGQNFIEKNGRIVLLITDTDHPAPLPSQE